jgi:hypothetical protein
MIKSDLGKITESTPRVEWNMVIQNGHLPTAIQQGWQRCNTAIHGLYLLQLRKSKISYGYRIIIKMERENNDMRLWQTIKRN